MAAAVQSSVCRWFLVAAAFCAAAACGGSPRNTRVTITVDAAALGAETLASITTIHLRVEGDLQVVDRNFQISAGALVNGQYEVTYSPLSKTGTLRIVITALDAVGNVLATNSAEVTIKMGRNSAVIVPLAGTSPEALLLATPAIVAFGEVVLGAPAGRAMVTLRNAGGSPTGAIAATVSGDTTSFVLDPMSPAPCEGAVLLPDQTCTLMVEFRPNESGMRAGRLMVAASPGGETRTDMSGTGIAAPVLTIDPDAADLGSIQVGQAGAPVIFTVSNSGGQPTVALSVALSGANAAEMQVGADGCSGKPLPAGASCTLAIALAPTSAGPKVAAVTVTGPLAASGDASVGMRAAAPPALAAVTVATNNASLSGMGLAGASLVIDPGTQDFGTVLAGGASSATFTVKNTGGLATTALTMALTGPNASEMTLDSDTCTGATLGAGGSCSITVNFNPTVIGAKSAQLGAHASVGGDSVAGLTAMVAAPGALTISPATIDFGGLIVGAAAGTPSAFTITNTGGTPSGALSLVLGGSGAGQFSAATDGCTGQSLAPAGMCTVSYAFRPTTPGNKTASLVVTATPGGVGAASLIGRGLATAALAANASATLGTIDVGSSSAPFTWTVRNTGDVPTGPLMTTTTGAAADFTVVNACAGTLGPAATCAITIALAPKTAGNKTVTLAVAGAPGGTVSLVATGAGRAAQPLAVARTGNGTGAVASDVPGINCGATCMAGYRYGTVVTLTATADLGSTFSGWAGACTGTGVCTVALTAAQTVTATFTLNRYTLSVKTSGATTGLVSSNPTGIDCGADCTEAYNHGTTVTLAAAPAPGWDFGGWAGACSGTGASCVVLMTQARSVTATFTQNSFALSVSVTGLGRVASTPTGIDCGSDCGEAYPSGTTVELTASAAAGQLFSAWGGACSAVRAPAPCTVTMTQVRAVTAAFTPVPELLTVEKPGKGSGSVTSKPAGIDCNSVLRAPDCSESYPYGSMVTLSAVPDPGMRIAGWTGVCAKAGATCTVTMTDAITVGVDFEPQIFTLAVQKVGAAAADCSVTANVGLISCGADCDDPYAYGTSVTLTALPVIGKTIFLGWDWPGCMTPPVGAAGPPLTCVVPVTMKTVVTARFEVPVSVTTRPASGGTVASMPAGISCGNACTSTFPSNTVLTLVATPAILFNFAGWTGACAGQGATCTIALGTTSVVAIPSFTSLIIVRPPIVVGPPVVAPASP